MQRKQSYVSSKLLYLFDSKLYPISPKTGTTPPPNIEIDSLLMSWGLLSGHYQNDGTIQTTKWSRFHQLFTIVFLWFMLISSVLYIFLDENSIWILYIGDLSITLKDMMPRIFYQVLILISNIKPAILAIYFYMKEESDKLSWLKIMQLCKGFNTSNL
jgi:hypothetical protein